MARSKATAKRMGPIPVAGKSLPDKPTEGQPEAGKKPRKPHRYRPGTVALREIRRYQKGTENLMAKLPVERLCRELAQGVTGDGEPVSFRSDALRALHTAAEDYVIEHFKLAQDIGAHVKKKTVQAADFILAHSIIEKKR